MVKVARRHPISGRFGAKGRNRFAVVSPPPVVVLN